MPGPQVTQMRKQIRLQFLLCPNFTQKDDLLRSSHLLEQFFSLDNLFLLFIYKLLIDIFVEYFLGRIYDFEVL